MLEKHIPKNIPIIVNNIDFTGEEVLKMGSPITPFNGILDGDNHTISGILMIGGSYTGLIGYATNTAVIKNIKIEDAEIEKVEQNSKSIVLCVCI